MHTTTGIHVAVVTAAGYPGKPDRYAARFKGLLDTMKERQYPKEITDKFVVMGGECNYLFKVNVSAPSKLPWTAVNMIVMHTTTKRRNVRIM